MDKFQLSDLCKRLDCRGSNELECTFPYSEATVFIRHTTFTFTLFQWRLALYVIYFFFLKGKSRSMYLSIIRSLSVASLAALRG